MTRIRLADLVHALAHVIAPTRYECACEQAAYMRSWKLRQQAELRALEGTPTTPAALEQEKWRRYEQWIRERAA